MDNCVVGSFRLRTLTLPVLMLAGAASVAAAQGSVTGRVIDTLTTQPIASAQVILSGTTRRAFTGQDGRYRLDGVAPGTAEIRVVAIGYSAATGSVTVDAGQVATLDFALAPARFVLDEIVVTATGEQRNREVGNAVSNVDASKITEEASQSSFADLMTGRAPGVLVVPSGGTTGAGSRVRIRGSNSVSLSNEPVIVIDGIRVENGANSISIGVGGQTPSRINDINPEDIESFEVVKGPAAAALYGTDAANGVIQIRTRRGRAGPTRWTTFAEYGAVNQTAEFPLNYRGLTAPLPAGTTCRLTQDAAGTCTIGHVLTANPLGSPNSTPFRSGERSQVGVSAQGGNEAITFYAAGDYERELGVYLTSDLRRANLRANIRNQARSNLDFTFSTGYVSSDLLLPDNDNNALGILGSGLLGSADSTFQCRTGRACQGYGFLLPTESYLIDSRQSIERFTGSFNMNWRPLSFLTARAVVGTDVTNRHDRRTFPPNQVPFNTATIEGSRASDRTQIFAYTANFNGTATFHPSPNLTSNTTAGVQYYRNIFAITQAFGRVLAAGSSTLNGTALGVVDENIDETKIFGGFIEEQVAIRDRLYLSLAVRGDDNSAFGQNFDFIAYPKFSASWVISEESFFPRPEALNSLRLRMAWGRSGLTPGTTDALPFFEPVAITADNTDRAGLTFGNLGNLNLRPEKTREIELGFDAEGWASRVSFEFTYYDKASTDALIARVLPPSAGVNAFQFDNLGRVSNKGVEISATWRVMDRPDLSWEVAASAWGNRNRLIDLGVDESTGQDIPPILLGDQRHVEGYPLGGYWTRPIVGWFDANGDGLLATGEVQVGPAGSERFFGTPFPSHGGTFSTEVTWRQRVRLFALLDGRYGHSQFNLTEQFRCGQVNCRGRNDPTAPIQEQLRAVAALLGSNQGFIEDAGFLKLRELSLTIFAPAEWASRIGASGLNFQITGRNLKTWTHYSGFDPEVSQNAQANFGQRDFLTQPPVRYWIFRVNANF
jgi:TonB-dependent starch-binding outer membrane protein SusC